MTKALKLNVKAIVNDRFGGRSELPRKLKKAGLRVITPAGIDQWIKRNNIAGSRLLDLLVLAETEGKALNIGSYIVNQAPKKAKKKAAR